MTTRTAPPSALRSFLKSEAAGGIVLMVAAAVAMFLANSPLKDLYLALIQFETGPVLTEKLGPMTVKLWINDGLMAIFFMLVGLEIKREFVDGRLSTWDQRRLPMAAALGGVVAPGLIYLGFTWGSPYLMNGWAIPAATDIAFAVGVLALLGSRAPTSLKLFLLTVAIVDDMMAVSIIAIFYTAKIDMAALMAAFAVFAVMLGIARAGVRRLDVYILLALMMWFAMLLSGVHATIAGVLAAITIPIDKTPGAPDSAASPLHKLEHKLHGLVAFAVVPIFGFANAGVNIGGLTAEEIFSPMPMGIAAGLFFGKQIGIFGVVYMLVKLGLANKLRGASWLQIYGVALLCGIGFTMSLFIGGLAFAGNDLFIEEAKLGTLMGSIASGLVGYLVLRFAPQPADQKAADAAIDREIAADGDAAGVTETAPAGSAR